MNRKNLWQLLTFLILLSFGSLWLSKGVVLRAPFIIQQSGSYIAMSLGDLLYEADAVVLGEFESTFPSKWNTPNGKLPKGVTNETISRNLYIYTEHVFRVSNFLKGDPSDSTVLIRTFGGRVGLDIMRIGDEASYQPGQTYLLFLYHDPRLVNGEDLGPYFMFHQGIYIVPESGVVSAPDANIEDLINYIENSPMTLPAEDIPDTSEARDVMQRIKTAYDLEEEAGHAFDTSKFSSVFVNDPRYEANPDTLEFIRENINNPLLESAGYLDYKFAYFAWWKEQGVIAERGHIENMSLRLRFIAIDVNEDIATVILEDVPGPTTRELTLVLIDGQWYIAGAWGVSAYPESSPSSAISPHIPDTAEVREVIKAVETAYDVEAEAAYELNVEKFPMVFINDSQYLINTEQLEMLRNITNDPTLVSAGYLDYQTARYQSQNIARGSSSNREIILQILSVTVEGDTATVYLHHTHQVMMIHLVQIDSRWYIARAEEI